MKSFFGAAILIFVGVVGWRIGGSLSSDALGMAVGILFGIMAGIPTALILLASQRREQELREVHPSSEKARQQLSQNAHGYQPPVIVVAGHAPTQPHYGGQGQHAYGQQATYGPQFGPNGEPYGQYGGYPQPSQAMLPGPVAEAFPPRQFKVVGEAEEMVEPW